MSEDAAEYVEERERERDEKQRAVVGSRGGGYDIELIICHLSSNQGLNISFPLSTEWKDELCRLGQTRWYWIINTASGNLVGPPAESISALSRVTGVLCLNNSCPSAIWFHPIFRSLFLNPCFFLLLVTLAGILIASESDWSSSMKFCFLGFDKWKYCSFQSKNKLFLCYLADEIRPFSGFCNVKQSYCLQSESQDFYHYKHHAIMHFLSLICHVLQRKWHWSFLMLSFLLQYFCSLITTALFSLTVISMIVPYYSFHFVILQLKANQCTTFSFLFHSVLFRTLSWINLAVVHPNVKILSSFTYLNSASRRKLTYGFRWLGSTRNTNHVIS